MRRVVHLPRTLLPLSQHVRRRSELLQPGESVEALVLAKDESFRAFKVTLRPPSLLATFLHPAWEETCTWVALLGPWVVKGEGRRGQHWLLWRLVAWLPAHQPPDNAHGVPYRFCNTGPAPSTFMDAMRR